MKKSSKSLPPANPESKPKRNPAFTLFSGLLALLLTGSAAWAIYRLWVLNFLPGKELYITAGVLILIALFLILCLLRFTKSKTAKIVFSILSIICIVIYSIGGFYIHRTDETVETVTYQFDELKVEVRVFVLKDGTVHKLENLNGQQVGILKSIGVGSTESCIAELATMGIQVQPVEYASIDELLAALLDRQVPAIIVTGAMSSLNSIMDLENEKLSTFLDDTKVLYEYHYLIPNDLKTTPVADITQDPFTILLSGMDSRNGFAEISRSDVNMVLAVNPQTKIVTIISIPRDYYVETTCEPEYGCLNGEMDKLTHTGIHGTQTTKATVEKMLGITINYTLQVNFDSVVQLVNALGGIEVNVAPGYAVDHFYVNGAYGVTEGVNLLDGEGALAYSRERYAYEEGDNQRIKNQQEVLLAIINKALSPAIIANYTTLLDAVAGAINTDLTSDEIQKLIQEQIRENFPWTFLTFSLQGDNQTLYCAEIGQEAFVMVPYEVSVQAARDKIQATLNGENPEQIEAIQPDPAGMVPSVQPETEVPAEEPVQEVPQENTEPVYTDPVYTDPGYTDPGYYDPSYYDPGYYDYGYYDPSYWGGYYDEYGNWISIY